MTVGNAKTKAVKPSMPGMVCPFFEAGALESTGDFLISSIMTRVKGASVLFHGGTWGSYVLQNNVTFLG